MENLRKHRLYRHNELSYGSGDAPLLTQISQKDLPNAAGAAIVHDPVNKTNSLPHSSSGEPYLFFLPLLFNCSKQGSQEVSKIQKGLSDNSELRNYDSTLQPG